MTDRGFRFGVVAGLFQSAEQWQTVARRIEDAGYSTILLPDNLNVIAPFSALAAAASVTTRLRLGTFVLAAPLRSAASIAWESATLDRLSGGRFELGLGTGRPDAANEAALFGVPFGTPGERVTQLGEILGRLRELFAGADAPTGVFAQGNQMVPVQQPRPPILVAASGRRMLELAAREADIITLASSGGQESDVAAKVALLRELAGDRFDQIELSYNTFAVGDGPLPPWLTKQLGVSSDQLANNGTMAVLTGSPSEIADVLLRRRDELGISYLTVSQMAMEQFAPIVELLAGK